MAGSIPDSSKLKFEFPKKLQTICLILIGVGLVITIAQFFIGTFEPAAHAVHDAGQAADTGHHGPGEHARAWMSIHLASLVAFPLGLGGIFFVAFNHVAGASWSITMRRLAESFFFFLVVPFAMMLVVMLGGMGDVFAHWVNAPATDMLIAHKAAWLNAPFFIARNILIVLLWIGFGFLFYKKSVAQDADGAIKRSRSMAKWSAGFLIVFGLSYTVHSFDLSMSMEPHWFSTLYGVYMFSGMVLTSFAVMVLWISFLKSKGYYGTSLNENHFHDLGKYIFGFTIFWAYMAVSQYLLIWFANIPEETFYFKTRTEGAWWYVTIGLVMLRFVLPFFLLLKREVKRNYRYMSGVAIILILGQVVDTYIHAYPTLDSGHFIALNLPELGTLLLTAGSFILIVGKALERASLIPEKDPRMEDCLHFHQ